MELFATACFNGNFGDQLMESDDLYWWNSTPDCWPPQRGRDGEGEGGGGGEVTGAEGGGQGGGRPTGCSPSHDCQRLELILLSKVQRLQIAFHAQASSTKWTPVQGTHKILHVREALLSHSIYPTSGLHKSLNILQSWPDQGSCSLSAYVMIFQLSR